MKRLAVIFKSLAESIGLAHKQEKGLASIFLSRPSFSKSTFYPRLRPTRIWRGYSYFITPKKEHFESCF